jgi:hypothetical protein
MAETSAAPTSLGFVALDEYATRLVGAAARARAAYGVGDGGPIIIPLFSNHGFLPFLRNLICSMRRIKVRNWLTIAMDNRTCFALMGTPGDGERSACVYPYSRAATGVTSGTGVATYRSLDFNRMVMQRPLWVRWLLVQGYSVIQCDLDIVWLHDPQPYLRALRMSGNVIGGRQRPIRTEWQSPLASQRQGAHVRRGTEVPDIVFQSEQASMRRSNPRRARVQPPVAVLVLTPPMAVRAATIGCACADSTTVRVLRPPLDVRLADRRTA